MGQFILDRMSINWAGEADLAVAKELRKRAGKYGLNKIIKQAIIEYLHKVK